MKKKMSKLVYWVSYTTLKSMYPTGHIDQIGAIECLCNFVWDYTNWPKTSRLDYMKFRGDVTSIKYIQFVILIIYFPKWYFSLIFL